MLMAKNQAVQFRGREINKLSKIYVLMFIPEDHMASSQNLDINHQHQEALQASKAKRLALVICSVIQRRIIRL